MDADLLFIEYPQYDLAFTGLSTWFGNDCYCHVGAIDPVLLARAQDAISSCESCNQDAELPFDWILDEVTGRDGSNTDYFLTEPARCPRCGSSIVEKTLVEADGGVFSL